MPRPRCCPKRVGLAIAAFAAIACLAIIHRAVFAGLLARGLIRRQRSRANHGRHNGTDNFGVPLHTDPNLPQNLKLREKKFMRRDDSDTYHSISTPHERFCSRLGKHL